MLPFVPNAGKNLNIQTDWGVFSRYPVKTHVVMSGDSLSEMMDRYLSDYLQPGDYIFISEKIVAISQGRAFPLKDIKPSRLAKFLVRFVYKSPYGIGLGSPWTMELAIRELGRPRILLAALVSALTKPFGVRGMFYRICGPRARAIDGPCEYTLPPYNEYAKMAPDRPDEVAKELKGKTGCGVVIIDANDIGVEVLGRSGPDIEIAFCKQVFADNPLDQSDQQTPLCIVRSAGPALPDAAPAAEETQDTPASVPDLAEGAAQDAPENTPDAPDGEDDPPPSSGGISAGVPECAGPA